MALLLNDLGRQAESLAVGAGARVLHETMRIVAYLLLRCVHCALLLWWRRRQVTGRAKGPASGQSRGSAHGKCSAPGAGKRDDQGSSEARRAAAVEVLKEKVRKAEEVATEAESCRCRKSTR